MVLRVLGDGVKLKCCCLGCIPDRVLGAHRPLSRRGRRSDKSLAFRAPTIVVTPRDFCATDSMRRDANPFGNFYFAS